MAPPCGGAHSTPKQHLPLTSKRRQPQWHFRISSAATAAARARLRTAVRWSVPCRFDILRGPRHQNDTMQTSPETLISANGIEICADTMGDPKDPPILLIMGASASMLL